MNKGSKILVTGVAGFIGFHLARRLQRDGYSVCGIDNLNEYYERSLKLDRLAQLGIDKAEIGDKLQNHRPITGSDNTTVYTADLKDRQTLAAIFDSEKPDIVAHLAAQAGVRYSLENPHAYADSNLVAFLNLLENCRSLKVGHLVYASSSSVYGANEQIPFSVEHNVDHPVSLYAATKKANELMAHTYAHLYGLPSTGLRFFTVYGPWGRPDMAYYRFTRLITAGKPIQVYNYGKMRRDFTYIDDIIEGVVRVLGKPASGDKNWSGLQPDPSTSRAPYLVFNIGNNQPVELMAFIRLIENKLGKKAVIEMLPMQPGDVVETFADIDALQNHIGYRPGTALETGIESFIEWFRTYHKP